MQPFLHFIWQWFTIVISGVMERVLRSLCLSAVSKLLGLESWDVDVFSIPGSTLYLLIQALPLGLTTLLIFLLSIYWPLSLLNQNSFSSCGIPPRIPQSKHPRADNNQSWVGNILHSIRLERIWNVSCGQVFWQSICRFTTLIWWGGMLNER